MSDYLFEKEKYLKSLTVGELIDILKQYPSNMKVMITWESTVNEFKKMNVYEAVTGSLYLDGDNSFYKNDFAKNPKENE